MSGVDVKMGVQMQGCVTGLHFRRRQNHAQSAGRRLKLRAQPE
jgi:hypothetical protein